MEISVISMAAGIAAITSQPCDVDSDNSRNRRAWDATSDDSAPTRPPAFGERRGLGGLVLPGIGIATTWRCRRPRRARIWLWRRAVVDLAREARCPLHRTRQLARQLDYARAAVTVARADVRLVHAAAETPPFPDGSFDIVFCDHGAFSFTAPGQTIPQAARLLRSGGILAFSVAHPLREICLDWEQDRLSRALQRSYFELSAIDGSDGVVSHVRPIATYLTILLEAGFTLEKLLEPRPQSTRRHPTISRPLSGRATFLQS